MAPQTKFYGSNTSETMYMRSTTSLLLFVISMHVTSDLRCIAINFYASEPISPNFLFLNMMNPSFPEPAGRTRSQET